MGMDYFSTLITVSDDCKVEVGTVPLPRGGKPTAAMFQYEMLAANPYKYTQEEVLFQTWLSRQGDRTFSTAKLREMRTAFFKKAQPDLRSSPLAKSYGWGFLFDSEGRVALCGRETETYSEKLHAPGTKVVLALNSTKA